jgi:branched-subunit amino acid aminotransferase/4-amino-4-deoxychorismate lyase
MDPTQSGFAHGFGIFETVKLTDGRLCFWEAHWQRFDDSAKALGLPLDINSEQVLAAIRELVMAERLQDAVIKVSLLAAGAGAQCYVYSRPRRASSDEARLLFSADAPMNEAGLLAGHKTHNYMENMLLLRAAQAAGCSDVIRVNGAGQLVETALSNLFFIQDDTLFTPGVATGLLPGVVRAVVIEAAEILGISVVEGSFVPNVLQLMDAAFVTNSLVGIQPVNTLVVDQMERNVNSKEYPMVLDLMEALEAVETATLTDLG